MLSLCRCLCLCPRLPHRLAVRHNARISKDTEPGFQETDPAKNYSKTVLLPKSTYPWRHSRTLELDPNNDISLDNYDRLRYMARREAKFTLHDGPPYANGSLHFGHAINKFLKDMICRRKILEGYDVHYRPGWDCHGLPIELKAISRDFQTLSPIEIRQKAKQFALNVIEEHKKNFMKWGIIGDWSKPYLTLDNRYVSNQISIFSRLLDKGLLFRDQMPVFWSPTAHTALAEAELQYNDRHISPSVFVKFKLKQMPNILSEIDNIYALIWTTTPWTLPANQAIAYSSHIEYCVVTKDSTPNEHFIVAKDLIVSLEQILMCPLIVKQVIKGSQLEGTTYDNPIGLSNLLFLESSHVTTTKGTGLVHTAPNHGLDDFKLFVKNKIKPNDCIVDEKGRFVNTNNPLLEDKLVLKEGNEAVIELLADNILFRHDYTHSYPYDWRYNEPVIVRTSPQWFLNIESIRGDCIDSISQVQFHPELFRDYLINQLKVRPNWCISRQRSWGVPIPVFFHKEDTLMRKPLTSNVILEHIGKQFEQKGCDIWWLNGTHHLVPNQMIESQLKIPASDLTKGNDIFDIWFDSGISWKTALDEPQVADLYLEGYDQLRGWFQSSLILSVALRKHSPYKQVKIHGFAMDSEGKKMSKSIGNVLDPNTFVENQKAKTNCGSDGFRWWVAKHASDHSDQRIAGHHFDEALVNINRIRLTLRFMIGVLHDFDASAHICSLSEMSALDKYLLHLLHQYLNEVTFGYDHLELDKVVEQSLNFIIPHVSGFYFTRVRHRLYCDHKSSLRRRSSLTVIYYLYNSIVSQLAPILPHIMTEANNHLPIDHNGVGNKDEWNQTDVVQDMRLILSMTDLINKELTGKHLIEYDCQITSSDDNCLKSLAKFQPKSHSMDSELCDMLLMSSVKYSARESLSAKRDGITLRGCSDQHNYELLITSANNFLCNRCRRYTAISESRVCDHCSRVLASN